MSLVDDLAGLPEDALVPVGWIREQLDASPPEKESMPDLTVEEVAERLNRAPSTVRGWINDDKIPQAYKLNGREWLVPPAALEEFLERQRDRSEGTTRKNPDLGAWREMAESTA